MEYTLIMQETLDIDWFAVDQHGYIGHFASGGGSIPGTVAKSIEDNRMVINYFRSLPEITIAEVSSSLEKNVNFTSVQEKNRYAEDFISITRKGIFSFDKTIPCNFDDDRLHIVSTPLQPLKAIELPENIAAILNRTKFKGEFSTVQNLTLADFG